MTDTSGRIYLESLRAHCPSSLLDKIDRLLSSSKDAHATLENVLRFVSGAEADAPTSIPEWERKQVGLMAQLHSLKPKAPKRGSSDVDPDESNGHANKRPRIGQESGTKAATDHAPNAQADDTPLYTLHSISTTSPVRKKVDITITAFSILFVNPTSNVCEARVERSLIRRAFVLPTRGKQKAHWTVVMLSTDTVPAQDKRKPAADASPQIIFGIDANPTAVFRITNHATSSEPESHAKSSSSLSSLLAFLSHLPEHTQPIIQPSSSVFSSKASSGLSASGSPGVDAYRGAKAGTLWFMEEGILWGESKPCEFWAVSELVGEGVRVVSATGRTCSVYLSRKPPPPPDGEEEEEYDDDEGIETEFSMIDGKEIDPIRQWQRQFRPLFGKKPNGSSSSSPVDVKGKGKAVALPAVAGPMSFKDLQLDSDSEDSDYDHGSTSGGGSSTSSSSSSSGSDDEEEEEEGSGVDDASEGAEDDEDAPLDPARHPLLRAGAMPKRVSRAAMDMVVAMVEDDMMGGGSASEGTADNPHELDSDDELDA